MSSNVKKKKKLKKKKKNKLSFFTNSNFTIFEVILFIFASIIFGMIAGCILTYSSSSLSLMRSDSHLGEIINSYKNITNNFYGDVDRDEITNSAIKGMIDSLDDPHSAILNSNYSDEFNEKVDGKFVGIGIEVVEDDEYFVIKNVVDDSPAYKNGIKTGDIILSIDDVDCYNISLNELKTLIDGNINTYLKIIINRDDEQLEFKLKREYIDIINVTDKIFNVNDKKIGYIRISVFSSNSYEQFNESFKTINNEKIDSLIIDLRSNPGGQLQQARKILSLFFNKSTVLYQLKNNNKTYKVYSINNKTVKYPIVILINENTASAAEVVTSCFIDNYDKVTIIGTKSYGKGSVQKSQTLISGMTIKYTVEEWLTSKGKSIDEIGIEPDIEVYNEDDRDLQLVSAINELK